MDNIFYVYATRTAKAPMSHGKWGKVDDFFIEDIYCMDPDYPLRVRIANSGTD